MHGYGDEGRAAIWDERRPVTPWLWSTSPNAVEADTAPYLLQPRGRATVVVLVLGLPLLGMHVAARVAPDVLWFDEVGQQDVYRRAMSARTSGGNHAQS